MSLFRLSLTTIITLKDGTINQTKQVLEGNGEYPAAET